MVTNVYAKYIICYDIENVKNRNKLYKSLKNFGLVPIQYFVFFGDLNKAELSAVKRLIKEILDEKTDKCIWAACNLTVKEIKSCFGYKNFKFIEADGYETI